MSEVNTMDPVARKPICGYAAPPRPNSNTFAAHASLPEQLSQYPADYKKLLRQAPSLRSLLSYYLELRRKQAGLGMAPSVAKALARFVQFRRQYAALEIELPLRTSNERRLLTATASVVGCPIRENWTPPEQFTGARYVAPPRSEQACFEAVETRSAYGMLRHALFDVSIAMLMQAQREIFRGALDNGLLRDCTEALNELTRTVFSMAPRSNRVAPPSARRCGRGASRRHLETSPPASPHDPDTGCGLRRNGGIISHEGSLQVVSRRRGRRRRQHNGLGKGVPDV